MFCGSADVLDVPTPREPHDLMLSHFQMALAFREAD